MKNITKAIAFFCIYVCVVTCTTSQHQFNQVNFKCGFDAINREVDFINKAAAAAAKKKFGKDFVHIPCIKYQHKGTTTREEVENYSFINQMWIRNGHNNFSTVALLDLSEEIMWGYGNKESSIYTYNKESAKAIENMKLGYQFYTALLPYHPKYLLADANNRKIPYILFTEDDEMLFLCGELKGKPEFCSIDDFVEKYNLYYIEYIQPEEKFIFPPDSLLCH